MKVLVLSPYPEGLTQTLERCGDEVLAESGLSGLATQTPDWTVSFGHRAILTPLPRMINIHIGALPYNRGADPNFWSWFDNTPKGVTIHQITKGIDTGPILAQSIMTPHFIGHTLRSSYEVLMREAEALFAMSWPHIRAGKQAIPQSGPSSYHRAKDKEPWMKLLGYGWDEPCAKVEMLGRKARAERVFDLAPK